MTWEITITELKDNGTRYKVTRRFPNQSVSETKMFLLKEAAKKQFEVWLKEAGRI